jgi:hypothetical protein
LNHDASGRRRPTTAVPRRRRSASIERRTPSLGAERLAGKRRATAHRSSPQSRHRAHTPRLPRRSPTLVVEGPRRHQTNRRRHQALRVHRLPETPRATSTTPLHLHPKMPRRLQTHPLAHPRHPNHARITSCLFNTNRSLCVEITSFTAQNNTADQEERTQQARSLALREPELKFATHAVRLASLPSRLPGH